MPTGTTTIDFGAFPGNSDVTITVTGQAGIVGGSLVEAWLFPAATADHTVDEHIIAGPRILAHTVVAATGFSITGVTQQDSFSGDSLTYGVWNVAWVWA